jgi:hypothetical protein
VDRKPVVTYYETEYSHEHASKSVVEAATTRRRERDEYGYCKLASISIWRDAGTHYTQEYVSNRREKLNLRSVKGRKDR